MNTANLLGKESIMIRINFKVFLENSSSRDELCEFGDGSKTLEEAAKNMWCPKAKAEVTKLKKLPAKNARKRMNAWASRNGIASII